MPTASQFIAALHKLKTEREFEKLSRHFKEEENSTKTLGVKSGDVFALAATFREMPFCEINLLLESDYYEARLGAVSIMDIQVRDKRTPPGQKKKIFELYFTHKSRLNKRDFVERAAPAVVGEYLVEKDRSILYSLATSEDAWERRTAIVSTLAFVRRNEFDDAFCLCQMLLHDEDERINKAVGSVLREAGKRDPKRLRHFLDKHAGNMPDLTLHYALEKIEPAIKGHFLKANP